jgi:hypothetical protein
VNAICDHDDIKAISFVGSNVVSHLIMIVFSNFTASMLLLCDTFSFTLNDKRNYLTKGNPVV